MPRTSAAGSGFRLRPLSNDEKLSNVSNPVGETLKVQAAQVPVRRGVIVRFDGYSSVDIVSEGDILIEGAILNPRASMSFSGRAHIEGIDVSGSPGGNGSSGGSWNIGWFTARVAFGTLWMGNSPSSAGGGSGGFSGCGWLHCVGGLCTAQTFGAVVAEEGRRGERVARSSFR